MHCLSVIIRRNAEAAGRAEAHATNDGDTKLADQILTAHLLDGGKRSAFYEGAYQKALQEG